MDAAGHHDRAELDRYCLDTYKRKFDDLLKPNMHDLIDTLIKLDITESYPQEEGETDEEYRARKLELADKVLMANVPL